MLAKEVKRERKNRTPFSRDPKWAIIDYYKRFKSELSSKDFSTELNKLIELYNPDLVRRVVKANARKDVVEKGIIKQTNNTYNRMQYAWCLAVFKVARLNPALLNVPGIKTTDHDSYPYRSRKPRKG